MKKEQRINEIYNILIQFEKISDPASGVNENTYKGYLDRLWVWYMGYGNLEIANSIKGLELLGSEAGHDTVKRTAFHIIDILNKESRDYDAL